MEEEQNAPVLVAEESFVPGNSVTVFGESPSSPFAAVFEDDGETGYFYGLDTRIKENPILDALHVYNAQAVTDRDRESIAQVVWSADGLRVVLLLNDYPHAAFDFEQSRGYCRTGFPPPSAGGFSAEGHEWSDEILQYFT